MQHQISAAAAEDGVSDRSRHAFFDSRLRELRRRKTGRVEPGRGAERVRRWARPNGRRGRTPCNRGGKRRSAFSEWRWRGQANLTITARVADLEDVIDSRFGIGRDGDFSAGNTAFCGKRCRLEDVANWLPEPLLGGARNVFHFGSGKHKYLHIANSIEGIDEFDAHLEVRFSALVVECAERDAADAALQQFSQVVCGNCKTNLCTDDFGNGNAHQRAAGIDDGTAGIPRVDAAIDLDNRYVVILVAANTRNRGPRDRGGGAAAGRGFQKLAIRKANYEDRECLTNGNLRLTAELFRQVVVFDFENGEIAAIIRRNQLGRNGELLFAAAVKDALDG